jgi:NADPH-dependent ferric siderophore reductase
MVRVVVGGDGLRGFGPTPFTDRYLKLVFPPEVEGRHERTRTYTIRSFGSEASELSIDFVVHGVEGLAGPWGASAEPGDRLNFRGLGGAYAPSDAAAWDLLIGDESALPAIASALEVMPAGVGVKVLLEVEVTEDEHDLKTSGHPIDANLITWIHRGAPASTPLTEEVAGWEFPPWEPQVFLHGDAGFVKELRRFLCAERGVCATALSASGYWRRGVSEEGWRAEKAQWKEAVASDEATLGIVAQ